jgi:hypothetical protein
VMAVIEVVATFEYDPDLASPLTAFLDALSGGPGAGTLLGFQLQTIAPNPLPWFTELECDHYGRGALVADATPMPVWTRDGVVFEWGEMPSVVDPFKPEDVDLLLNWHGPVPLIYAVELSDSGSWLVTVPVDGGGFADIESPSVAAINAP